MRIQESDDKPSFAACGHSTIRPFRPLFFPQDENVFHHQHPSLIIDFPFYSVLADGSYTASLLYPFRSSTHLVRHNRKLLKTMGIKRKAEGTPGTRFSKRLAARQQPSDPSLGSSSDSLPELPTVVREYREARDAGLSTD